MYAIEPLSDHHNRFAFTCGNEKLDRYLHEIAHQAKRKGMAAVYVAVNPDNPSEIVGYYSLSSFMIRGLDIPDALRKKRGLPAHEVGATLLGRLARSKNHSGTGIGDLLVVDALKRAYMVSGDVGSVCMVADAIEEARVTFYEKFGFVRIEPQSLRMVLMMDTIAALLPGVPNKTQIERPA